MEGAIQACVLEVDVSRGVVRVMVPPWMAMIYACVKVTVSFSIVITTCLPAVVLDCCVTAPEEIVTENTTVEYYYRHQPPVHASDSGRFICSIAARYEHRMHVYLYSRVDALPHSIRRVFLPITGITKKKERLRLFSCSANYGFVSTGCIYERVICTRFKW